MAEMKDLPPLIQELLKKKGWSWPPDEKLKAQFRETIKNAAGSIHTDPSILEELYREFGWTYHARRQKKNFSCHKAENMLKFNLGNLN